MNRYRMYINGESVESRRGAWFPVYDPSTEEIIAEVPDADASDVDRAVKAAAVVAEHATQHGGAGEARESRLQFPHRRHAAIGVDRQCLECLDQIGFARHHAADQEQPGSGKPGDYAVWPGRPSGPLRRDVKETHAIRLFRQSAACTTLD